MVMESQNDCGPEALRRALNAKGYKLSLADLKRVWDWQNYGGLREDLQDSPWHHFAVLARLNIPWKIKTCAEILAGLASPGKTVILLHNPDNPVTKQHWVVLKSVSVDGVSVFWGNDTERSITPNSFEKWYAGGSPACAYEVGVGKTYLTWYQRLYVQIFDQFC